MRDSFATCLSIILVALYLSGVAKGPLEPEGREYIRDRLPVWGLLGVIKNL